MTALKVIFKPRLFENRQEAGKILAEHLQEYKGQEGLVVLAIPRGGVVVAGEIAVALGGELDVAIVRKLRAPFNPELAIGAINEKGHCFLNKDILRELEIPEWHVEEEKEVQLEEIGKRAEAFRKIKPKVTIKGRPCILADDGIATGATMMATLQALRVEEPSHIVVALPVAPASALPPIVELADEVVCLCAPAFFEAVGQFYVNFEQVSDEEVVEILKG